MSNNSDKKNAIIILSIYSAAALSFILSFFLFSFWIFIHENLCRVMHFDVERTGKKLLDLSLILCVSPKRFEKKWVCRRILFVFLQNTWTIEFAYLKTKWIYKCTKLRSIGIFIGKITTLMDCIQNTQSNAQNELVAVFTAVVVVHFTYDEITLETIWCVKSIKVLWFRFNISDTEKKQHSIKSLCVYVFLSLLYLAWISLLLEMGVKESTIFMLIMMLLLDVSLVCAPQSKTFTMK